MNTVQDDTLQKLEELDHYVDRTLKFFKKNLQGPVLEIGAGTGNITVELLERGLDVLATEVHEERLQYLVSRVRAGCKPSWGKLKTTDLNLSNLDSKTIKKIQSQEPSGFGNIVAFNVLEHVEKDLDAVKALREVLKPGGSFCLVVPAHQFLFSEFDASIGHYRRYTTNQIYELFSQAGYKNIQVRYFNSISTLGWFLNFKLLKRKELPKGQLKLFKIISPLLELEDHIKMPFGLSVLCTAEA